MDDRIKLALIYGSTREGRLCDTVAQWTVAEIGRHPGFLLDVIDPATLELPQRHLRTANAAVGLLKERFANADGFIVVTPEYNHGYPAALKFVIDSVSESWCAKPVGFVSYGGISGGIRAVEQLRQVFAELNAMTVRESVTIANVWEQFDDNGELRQAERYSRSMATMLAKLDWWAVALRVAREAKPYSEAVAERFVTVNS
jgi:NAD(P)H-dependent FMN reductase